MTIWKRFLSWLRREPQQPPQLTTEPTPEERRAVSEMLYRDVVAEAYARVEELFEHGGDASPGFLIEKHDLKLAVDSEEVGRDGIVWSSGQPSNLEKTASYRGAVAVGKRGTPGEFQALAADPTWQDNYATVLEGLHSGTYKLSVSPRVRPDDVAAAKEQLSGIEAVLWPLLKDQFGREWAKALNDGFSLWEIVGHPVEKLAYRRAWTVDQWILDEDEREWEGVSFKPAGSTAEPYELPAEKLLLYSHNRTGMNLPGEPQIRYAAPHILIKQGLIRLDMQACSAHGLGWRIIESEMGVQDAGDDQKTVTVLSTGKASDNPTLKLAPGRKLVWIGPGGVLPDFASRIDYHEKQIEKAIGARAARLEKSTYANADLVDRVDRRTVRLHGSLFARFVTEQLIPVIAEQLFGGTAIHPTPILEFDLAADAQSAAVLVQLIQAGVITPTPEDEAVIRKQFNLPPRTAAAKPKEPAAVKPAVGADAA